MPVNIKTRRVTALGLAALVASCGTLRDPHVFESDPDLYAAIAAKDELAGPEVLDLSTPLARALVCIGEQVGKKASRDTFAVGKVEDMTGQSMDTARPVITHGAALMLISALDKMGLKQVERFDTSVAELELKYANQKLIGDETGEEPFKKIKAGVLSPSDYVVVGGITELDFNTYSSAFDSLVGPFKQSNRLYAITVAADLRLIETDTLKVVDTVSFKKQIFGRENQRGGAGYSLYLGLEVSNRERAQEPIQTSVRLVLERAAIDLVSRLYHADPKPCLPPSTADVSEDA